MPIQDEAYPQYESRPIILVHLLASKDSNIAWCAPIPFIPGNEDSYPKIPRVMCPACARAHVIL